MSATQRQTVNRQSPKAESTATRSAPKPIQVADDAAANVMWMQQAVGNQATQQWASGERSTTEQPAQTEQTPASVFSNQPSAQPNAEARENTKPDQSSGNADERSRATTLTQSPEATVEPIHTRVSSEPASSDVSPGQTQSPTDEPEHTSFQGKQAEELPVSDHTPEANAPAAEAQQAEARQTDETSAPQMIVEDSFAEPQPGQMRKTEFLSQLRTLVDQTAQDSLEGTGRTTIDCPYIEFWFGYYAKQDVQHIEKAIRKYAPEAQQAATVQEMIPKLLDRVSRAVKTWATTGVIAGVPDELPAGGAGMGDPDNFGHAPSSESDVGARDADNPLAIQSRLGTGTPLDSSVRARMESIMGMDFSHVRVHTDARAAQLSSKEDARAFAVGNHIAFGSGEYRPGTIIGDALIAHELAHVAQQQGANPQVGTIGGDNASSSASLEEDADKSAVSLMASLWSGAMTTVGHVTQNAMPRLRSGLRVSRCRSDPPAATRQIAAQAQVPATVSIPEVNAPNTPPPVKRIPPRVNTGVAISASATPANPVTLSIDGAGGGNGSATINGAPTYNLTRTETVQLQGVDQTEPGHAGNLKLVARQGANQLAESNRFSVAAYPIAIGFTFAHLVQNEADPDTGERFWGAAYDLTFVSDSGPGHGTDCNQTKISENVLAVSSTGLFVGAVNRHSSFLETTDAQQDNHVTGTTDAATMRRLMDAYAGADSTAVANQFFRFSCARTGIAEDRDAGPKVPTSGFRITKSTTSDGVTRVFHVKKEGFANNGVAAGTVDDSSTKDIPV